MARNKYDVDEVVEQKFDIKQLKRLVDYIRPYKGKMLFVLVLMLSSSGLGMFLPNKAYYTMLRYERYSMLLIMVLSLTGVLNGIIGTGVNFFFNGIINLLNSAINLIL